MYVKSVTIRNFRTFSKVELDFLYPGKLIEDGSSLLAPNVNLLLGNNGHGKTTILKAVALAATAAIIKDAGYVPYSLVRRKPGLKSPKQEADKHAEIEGSFALHQQDTARGGGARGPEKRTRVVIERRKDVERFQRGSFVADDPTWDLMYDNESPAFLTVGYGATRRLEDPEHYDAAARKRISLLRYQRVAGLFQEGFSLIPLEAWLPRLKSRNKGRYTQVVHLIDRMLMEPFRFDGQYGGGEYFFRHGKSLVPLGALSDGYRACIGWVSDLLYHICEGCPPGKKLVENRGIVLVDEVDLHLHPSWQRTVAQTIGTTFPNLQFIFTTHSPIVTGSLQAANIWVLDQKGASSKAVRLARNVHGLNADQVLVSDYFGLDTSRAPGMQKKMRDLNLRALGGDGEASLELLRHLADGIDAK